MRHFPCVARVLVSGAIAALVLIGCTLPPPIPPPTPLAESDLGQLAYVLGGDIWLKHLSGGEPQRLTEDGYNSEPLWSPTGAWLAFRKLDSQLWLYSVATGKAEAVDKGAPVNDFSWSPTADVLAYVVGSGVLHLRTLTAGSGESSVLLDPSASSGPGWILWHPDGKALAYTWMGEVETGKYHQQVRVQPATGGEPQVLIDVGFEEPSPVLAGWTPSGQYLLLGRGPRLVDSFLPDAIDLFRLPAGGLSDPAKLDKVAQAAAWQFTFDIATPPAGSAWAAQDALAIAVGSGPVWTQKRIEVGGKPVTPADQVAIQPAWAPDGRTLAYAGASDPGDVPIEQASQALRARHIWVIATDGQSAPRQITNDPAFRDESPRWSAAGDFVLFARLDAGNRASLWIAPSAGGEAQRVVEQISLPAQYDDLLLQIEWRQSFDWHPN